MNVRVVIGFCAVVLTLVGCGVSVAPASPASPAPAQPSGGPTTASSAPGVVPVPSVSVDTPSVPSLGSTASGPATAPTADPADLPADFPLPDGAHLDTVVRDGNGEIAATVRVTDGKRAFSFWSGGLSKHGYTVADAGGGLGAYEIRFSGHGCTGDSQIAITGTRAAVQCDRS